MMMLMNTHSMSVFLSVDCRCHYIERTEQNIVLGALFTFLWACQNKQLIVSK